MDTTDLYKSTGVLRYTIDNTGHKVYLLVDPGLANYYRSFLPKYLEYNQPKYPPHISVVRHETPTDLNFWGLHDNQKFEFYYSPKICSGEVYFWLNVFSLDLEKIRKELGLYVIDRYTRPPDGWNKTFHMTLGNFKSG